VAGQHVAARGRAGQQVVEAHAQPLGQQEQGVERQPPAAGLGLGDGAGRDAGQAGHVALVEVALAPHPLQPPAQATEGPLVLQVHLAAGQLQAEQAALHRRRPALRLHHPQVVLADLQHALGHVGHLVDERPTQLSPRRPPVGHGAEVEEAGAHPAEEADGLGRAPAAGELGQPVDHHVPRRVGPGVLDDGGLEDGGVAVPAARAGVEHGGRRSQPRLQLGRVRAGGDVEAGLATAGEVGQQGVLEDAHRGGVVDDPHHVVAQDHAAQQGVDIGDAAGDAVAGAIRHGQTSRKHC
jgi:hypothetical protein